MIQRMRPPPPTHSHRESEIAAFAIECYNCAGSGTCANYLAAETVSFCVEGVVAMVITSVGDMFRSLFLVALVFFSFFQQFPLFISTNGIRGQVIHVRFTFQHPPRASGFFQLRCPDVLCRILSSYFISDGKRRYRCRHSSCPNRKQ